MGHASFARGEYRALADRLGRGPVAMVEPADPAARRAWRDILEILFSPEDAALAALLPVVPTAVDGLTRRTGLSAETLRARLDAMADKGLVLDLRDRRTGATVYMLAPPVVGFFEFSMMRLDDGLPKARLARAYEAYMMADTEFLEEVSRGATVVGRTLVHEAAPARTSCPRSSTGSAPPRTWRRPSSSASPTASVATPPSTSAPAATTPWRPA